jgi:hypothetical protein
MRVGCWRDKNCYLVDLHNGNSGLQYFTLKFQKIFNSLQENYKKTIFELLFHLTFYVFLRENLVSNYEQLLILTDIDGSTLQEIHIIQF